MSFLQVGALWALPMVVVPLVIHWLYRRRHQTVAWPAMIFLQRASQNRRGPAKWRRRLILATRMAVIGALVLALARPLSTGRFGLAASRFDNHSIAFVLVDRSPSMQLRLANGRTRQEIALQNVAATLKTLRYKQIIVVDSVQAKPKAISSPETLLSQTFARSADSEANLPRMLEQTLASIRKQRMNRADVWICSDRQTQTWRPNDLTWNAISEVSAALGQGIRFHRLDFPEPAMANSAVTVSQIRPSAEEQGRGLRLTIEVWSNRNSRETVVPIQITIGNVTETVDVNVVDGRGTLTDHFASIPSDMKIGYGVVSLPPDANPADDRWYFVAHDSDRPRFAIVTEEHSDAIAAAAEVLGEIVFESTIVNQTTQTDRNSLSWTDTKASCLLWQRPLPGEKDALEIRRFVEAGGSVIFFPPLQSNRPETSFAGLKWQTWVDDASALASYDDYTVTLDRYRPISGDAMIRATLGDNRVLIGKRTIGQGSVWYCGADVQRDDGNFVRDGVILYALLEEAATASRKRTRDHVDTVAGQSGAHGRFTARWNPAWSSVLLRDGQRPVLWSEFGHHAGVYHLKSQPEDEGQLRAINRVAMPPEDRVSLSSDNIHALLPEAAWNVVSVHPNNRGLDEGFAHEIWFAVWLLVIAGLLLEAFLSLPRSPGAPA